jgi:iron complex outermembrane receptor protein
VPISGLETLKWVELNAAGRAYDYNTFGSGITGKLSALVRTVGGLAVRGTFGNAFRAPNVSELFSGQFDSFQLVADPCDTKPPSGPRTLDPMTATQCAKQGVPMNSAFGSVQQRAKFGGNKELQPETATVGTAGVVFEPLRGLAFTVEYWHIKIDNAITNLPTATVLAQCYQGGIDMFCNQIQRDPATHGISYIFDLNQNVGSVTTSGLDFSAAYQYRNTLGTFRHSVEGTYLFRYNVDTGTVDPTTMTEQILHGRGFFDLGVRPDLKLNLFTTWSHPSGLGVGFNARFIDSFQECDSNNCNDPSNARREVSKYATGDVFVTYALKASQGTTRIMAGVNNIVDAEPPTIYNGPALNTDESAYDFMGRQFYVRLAELF